MKAGLRSALRIRVGRRCWRDEAGATLVETLIALAISAAVVTMLGSAVYQFYAISYWGNDRLAVLHDLQNAGLWIGRDANEAASFTSGAGTVYGTLSWPDLSVQYRYSYDSGNTALLREHLVGGVPQSTVTVARHIAFQSDVSFAVSGSRLTVTITSTSDSVSASSTLTLTMRAR